MYVVLCSIALHVHPLQSVLDLASEVKDIEDPNAYRLALGSEHGTVWLQTLTECTRFISTVKSWVSPTLPQQHFTPNTILMYMYIFHESP